MHVVILADGLMFETDIIFRLTFEQELPVPTSSLTWYEALSYTLTIDPQLEAFIFVALPTMSNSNIWLPNQCSVATTTSKTFHLTNINDLGSVGLTLKMLV